MKKVMRKTRGLLILYIALTFVAQTGLFVGTLYTRRLIDSAVAGAVDLDAAFWFFVLSIGSFLLILPVSGLFLRYVHRVNYNLKEYFTHRMFRKDVHALQSENSHTYVSAYTNDLDTVEQNYLMSLRTLIDILFQFVASIAIVIIVSPWMLLILAGVVVIQVLLSNMFGGRIESEQEQKSALLAGYTSYVKQVLSAFHIIKGAGIEEKVRGDFRDRAVDVQRQSFQIDKTVTLTSSMQQVGATVGMLFLIAVSGWLVVRDVITIGGFILIITGFGRMMYPLQAFGEIYGQMSKARAVFRRVDELLQDGRPDSDEMQTEVKEFRRSLDLDRVCFAYAEGAPVFDEACVRFEKGRKYLVVGSSGGGKSTLLRLLRRYFEPQSGTVALDGIDLRTLDRVSYFKRISYIEQHVFVFEDTVRNNITLYKEYDREQIDRAIDMAGLRDFVDSTPDGLDYVVLDGGKNISGGERSRIAIARALLADSDILLLDEAFASLNDEIARRIERTLLALDGVTVINVSHVAFDDTRREYDAVCTVGGGRIVTASP